jgi:Putative prokaryotic signal transducing protein
MNDELVSLTVVSSEFEAQQICALLEVEGITCAQRPTNQGAAAWVGSAAGGSREVLVASRDLERARELIAPVEEDAG